MNNRTIKYIILISLFCGITFSLKANDKDLNKTIIKVVKAFKEKDDSTLNGLINKDIGLIVLFRRGVPDEFSRTDKIDFKNPIPEYLPYFDFSTDFKIKFQTLPVIDCSSMKWNKFGLFCDTLNIDCLLSTTARQLEGNTGEKVPDSEIKKFIEIENNSVRIVLADKNGGELIFYLTKIKNKWYLTILDRVTSDCSA